MGTIKSSEAIEVCDQILVVAFKRQLSMMGCRENTVDMCMHALDEKNVNYRNAEIQWHYSILFLF